MVNIDPTIAVDAVRLVDGDRQKQYGSPESNLQRIAGLWSAYLDVKVTPEDVSHMMVLLKVSRAKAGYKRDTSVDVVGYTLLADMFGRYDGSK